MADGLGPTSARAGLKRMKAPLLDAEALTGPRLRAMSAEKLDRRPFGALELDTEGRGGCNTAEAELARRVPSVHV